MFTSIHSLTASFSPYRMKRRCLTCCRGVPDWDTHQQCHRHRACSRISPCAVCTAWAPTQLDLAEAWLSKHPLIQRAPALVPSAASQPAEEGQPRAARDLPNETALLPPEGIGSDSAESPLELLTSGDSDLGEASPSRHWRPNNELPSRSAPSVTGARAGGNPPVVSHWPDSQRDVPARSSPGPRGLMRGSGSGGGPSGGSHLTGPQTDRSSPGPRGLMTGSGNGGDPSGGLHLTGPQLAIPGRSSPDPRGSIVGSGVVGITTHQPGPQGANAAGHTGWILPPNMPQATAPGVWNSRLVQAVITEATRSTQSVSAPTITAPPARQSLAEPAETAKKKKKKAKKRRAADSLSELPISAGKPAHEGGPPLKRKKLKKTKKLAGSKSQGNDPPNEAQLFAMMRLMAAKHGWSVEDQARPFGPDALPSTPPTAPTSGAPYPGLPGPGYESHQSGTSGAGRPTRGGVFRPANGAAFSPRPGARLYGPSVGALVRIRLVLSPRIVRLGRGRVVGYLNGPRPL